MATKRIAKVEVIAPGSNPDVDSDFNTQIKDLMFDHVADVYGHKNVASIITFSTLAAKSAISTVCTIYEVPFNATKKLTSLIPPPIEGVEMTLENIYDPDHERYSEAADFREAASSDSWKRVMQSAMELEGRYRGTGVHACGVIISSQNIDDAVPVQIREDDGRMITQWTYPDCESLGLIKFDFLGLKNVDIIQRCVGYIMRMGKTPLNVLELVHGNMDDVATYELFGRGELLGVFQFGSPLAKNFCLEMKPASFFDIAATTALLRPGPMSMKSHVHYAQRKNGMEKVELIHPEFKGSPLEALLEETYGLIVYQEQVMKISNLIADFTPKEADKLRKAMGKKKPEGIAAMEAKFMSGGEKNGYSEEALSVLWANMREFGRYGFNKSHSVAYAMTAYVTAYLKTHYPIEFMASLIEQDIGDKDKVMQSLQEATHMGLKIGTVDINRSEVAVSPDFSGTLDCDILYGLAGVSSVSKNMAQIIVDERNENGDFASVQDVVNRCAPKGVDNKKIYENLAKAGAFDRFGVSRRSIVDSLEVMLKESKTKTQKGAGLFDSFAMETGLDLSQSVNLSGISEWPFLDRIRNEADVIGLYLTEHPLAHVGLGLSAAHVVPIKNLKRSSGNMMTYNIVGCVTEITIKSNRNGGKGISVSVDDGTGVLTGGVVQQLVKGIDKYTAQKEIEKNYKNGDFSVNQDTLDKVCDTSIEEFEPFVKGDVYIFNVTYNGDGTGRYSLRINSYKKLQLGYGGQLPVRVRINASRGKKSRQELMATMDKFAKSLSTKFPGEYPLWYSIFDATDKQIVLDKSSYYLALAEQMQSEKPKEDTSSKKSTKKEKNLFETSEVEVKTTTKKRELPTPNWDHEEKRDISEAELSDKLEYIDTGYTVDKSVRVEEILTQQFGAERIDYGLYSQIYDR